MACPIMNQAVIKLEGITKVFRTDELETHALSGVHPEIKSGQYVSIALRPGIGTGFLPARPAGASYRLNCGTAI